MCNMQLYFEHSVVFIILLLTDLAKNFELQKEEIAGIKKGMSERKLYILTGRSLVGRGVEDKKTSG